MSVRGEGWPSNATISSIGRCYTTTKREGSILRSNDTIGDLVDCGRFYGCMEGYRYIHSR